MESRLRKRWQSDARLDSLLVSGFSLGEGIAVAVVIGSLLALAVVRYAPALEHTAVSEVLELSRAAQVDWMEQWVVKGGMPVLSGALRVPLPAETLQTMAGFPYREEVDLTRTVQSLDVASTDGEILFYLRRQGTASTRLAIQFRPAFGPGDSPATVLWLCGRAAVPSGLLRVGEDRTTLPNEALPSACRGHS